MQSVTFHATEPGHLAFRELVDGVGEQHPHLFITEDAQDVLSDEFIFKAVINKVFRRNS